MNKSKTIKIGQQIWMTEDLNVNTYLNGDIIPYANSREQLEEFGKQMIGAWCYANFDKAEAKLGRFYNEHAINDPRGILPEGFHVPDEEDWKKLIYFLGGVKKIESVMDKLINPSGLSLRDMGMYWSSTYGKTLTDEKALKRLSVGFDSEELELEKELEEQIDWDNFFYTEDLLDLRLEAHIRCISDFEEDIGDVYWIASEAGSTANDDFM